MGQQLFATNSLGGFLTNTKLSKEIRHRSQPLMYFRQFAQPEGAVGKNRGDTLTFDKISNISTAGGTIAETSTIPSNNFTITQGSITITEYAKSIGALFSSFVNKLSSKIVSFDMAVSA